MVCFCVIREFVLLRACVCALRSLALLVVFLFVVVVLFLSCGVALFLVCMSCLL